MNGVGGDDDDQSAAADLIADFGHDMAEFGRALGARAFEYVENLHELAVGL